VKLKPETNFHEFLSLANQKLTGSPYPALAEGNGSGDTSINFSVFLSNEMETRTLPRNEHQISVKFIRPYGDYPNILRLFYTPKSGKNHKPNYAYKVINHQKIDDEVISRKYKHTHHFIVDFDRPEDIVTTQIIGKALAEVERMTQSIVRVK
jgi:hypothetical protein